MSLQSEFARAERAALVTVIEGAPHGRLLVRPDESVEGTLGDDGLDRAALPHVDHFLAGNSIASLEELADLMEGGLA